MSKSRLLPYLATAALCMSLALPAWAQLTVSDTLNSTKATNTWTSLTGACLTAGSKALSSGSSIPGCSDLAYYSGTTQVGGITGSINTPDPDGQGALRLTNGGSGGTNKTGSVVSTVPFPTNQGVQLTFSTVTYGGNAYNNGVSNSGADGLAFFLIDGAQKTASGAVRTPSIGAFGGSLGYSCSNSKAAPDGASGGYLAVATDEFGNFSNPSDNTSDGPGQTPGSIVVRGSGDINWVSLNKNYPTYYPSSLSAANQVTAVQNTCKAGTVQNWSGSTVTDPGNKAKTVKNQGTTTLAIRDYQLIVQPQSVVGTIFNQENASKPLRASANLFTYGLTITQDGLLSLSYTVNGGITQNVISKQSITANNGSLPTSFLFGFAAGTGGGSNVHEITCFKAAPINTATNSAGTNVQSNQVQTGSQVYLSYYHPLNSWGQLTATPLVAGTDGSLTFGSTPTWDAYCVLTGSSGTTSCTGTAQASTSRVVLSSTGAVKDTAPTSGAGVAFQVGKLSTAQVTALGGTATATTLIDYLRGVRTNEVGGTGSGLLRKRDGVLGDIRNASPTWVGPPSTYSYTLTGYDNYRKASIAEYGAAYSAFAVKYVQRANVVYSGANDGMMHGFQAGAFAVDGSTFVSTNNNGKELLAYVPYAVSTTIHSSTAALDFSSPSYSHNAYVDATPVGDDLYYAGAWHTWLVGGLGAGGNASGEIGDNTSTGTGALFALDVTDPSTFAESAAASLVIGEWTSSTITCTNVSSCGDNLGNVYGTPVIRLLHDGNWAVIFGNGRNSKNGAAGIFIMSVDRTTGAKTFRYLDTNTSSTTNKNGIDFVVAADLDADHVTDYVYAGDTAGHVWRFDLTSTTAGSWAVRSTPIFTTSSGRPISTAIATAIVNQSTGAPRMMLDFGTGRQAPATFLSAATYATGTQAVYGIWDWDMAAFNKQATSGYQLAQLSTAPSSPTLAAQSYTDVSTTNNAAAMAAGISGYRTSTQTTVCWYGGTACGTNTDIGWILPLTNSTEQIIYAPTISGGILYFNTYVPGVSQTLSCTSQPASGFTMALSPGTGGALNTSVFSTEAALLGFTSTGSGSSSTAGGALITGLGLSLTGSVQVVQVAIGTSNTSTGTNTGTIIASSTGAAKGSSSSSNAAGYTTYIVGQKVDGTGGLAQTTPAGIGTGKRVTWLKLR